MIPFVDLKAQYRSLKPEVDRAIQQVLDESQYILGPAVSAFERDFAAFCQTTEAIGVNSGTSALHLALLAVGVRPGDEVITVPFTFVATVSAIEYAGAKPVLVDVEPDYWTMDPAKLEAAITPRTKAIMPVHLYGQPADMDPILAIAEKTRHSGHRGRLPVSRIRVPRPAMRVDGTARVFQFLSREESRSLRRGRRSGDE